MVWNFKVVKFKPSRGTGNVTMYNRGLVIDGAVQVHFGIHGEKGA